MRTTIPVSIAELAARLIALPDQIETAEEAVIETARALRSAEDRLILAEAALFEAKAVIGTNETERKRSLHALTVNERTAISTAREAHEDAAKRLRVCLVKLSSLRAVARLLGGQE